MVCRGHGSSYSYTYNVSTQVRLHLEHINHKWFTVWVGIKQQHSRNGLKWFSVYPVYSNSFTKNTLSQNLKWKTSCVLGWNNFTCFRCSAAMLASYCTNVKRSNLIQKFWWRADWLYIGSRSNNLIHWEIFPLLENWNLLMTEEKD